MHQLAIFLHHPYCSVQSVNGIIKALGAGYRFKIFSRHYLELDFFDDVDMVVFPGGIGDADSFDYLMKNNKYQILDYINRGGKYLGICMGAYWAGPHYFNILDRLDTVQYIKRPNTDTHRPHAKAIDVTWQGESEKMFFYDGCAIVGNGPKDVWAYYSNHDSMAIQQGNVGLIGCHPESTFHWYQSYTWMPKYWHQGRHYRLLKNFVDHILLK